MASRPRPKRHVIEPRRPIRAVEAIRAIRAMALALLVVAVAATLAGCAGQDQRGSSSARVSSWVSGAADAAIGTLDVDNRNVDLTLSRHDSPSAVKTVCALMTNDAETAIGNLPTPDAQLTDDLNTAYEDAAAAGGYCYKGAGGNRELLDRSARERTKLAPLLEVAISRIEAITGRAPSTTTTQPAPNNDPFAG